MSQQVIFTTQSEVTALTGFAMLVKDMMEGLTGYYNPFAMPETPFVNTHTTLQSLMLGYVSADIFDHARRFQLFSKWYYARRDAHCYSQKHMIVDGFDLRLDVKYTRHGGKVVFVLARDNATGCIYRVPLWDKETVKGAVKRMYRIIRIVKRGIVHKGANLWLVPAGKNVFDVVSR